MSDAIAPRKTVTFTLTRVPRRLSHRRTLERLMRMQPGIQAGLKRLARRRRQHDNKLITRGGRFWHVRVPAAKLVLLDAGRSFTLTITPQIIPDLRSVERYLEAKPAG